MAKNKKLPKCLEMYVSYINNTGRSPLPIDMFDEDYEPIGPMIRAQLVKGGFIRISNGKGFMENGDVGIVLRPDLITLPTSKDQQRK